MGDKILIATAKGLVTYVKKSNHWVYLKTEFLGQPASMVYVDDRTNTWWVSLAHKHWGQKLHYSVDEGEHWVEVGSPKYPKGSEVRPGEPANLKYIWSLAHGGADKPGRIYVGTDPGGLFVSQNNGETFSLVESLWNHPSRPDHWFGGGRDNAGIHTIVIDPRDSDHIYIGVSCAGVFETKDAGISWDTRHDGLRADYLPNPQSKWGHDPHSIEICQANPDVLWQQNHCGVFKSTNAGKHWDDVTDKKGVANYGFALAIDNADCNRAWVIPATSDQLRVAVNQSLCVCRTDDGGKTWKAFREGLPQDSSFDIVLRHSFANQGETMVFGTNTGNLFVSENDGESWVAINNYLPTIFALCFA